jgi:hypothetical protein
MLIINVNRLFISKNFDREFTMNYDNLECLLDRIIAGVATTLKLNVVKNTQTCVVGNEFNNTRFLRLPLDWNYV